MQTVADVRIPAGRTRRHWGLLLVPGFAIAVAALCLLYVRLSYLQDPNSDTAAAILQAQTFLQVNVLLRGWRLTNTAYALDVPLYALGILAVGGIKPILLR